jgi:phage terminase small subunit
MDEFALDDQAAVLLLEVALAAFDEMRAAQRIVAKEGLTTRDRFGQVRANPAAAIVRDARLGMLRAFQRLNLDVEPARPGPGRPGGGATP